MAGLADLLKNRGWITNEQLDDALARQRGMGGLIGTCLLELGAIKEDLLLRVLSEQLRVPAATADDLRDIPPTVSKLLPRDLATRYLAVPFRKLGSRVDVALIDVRNLALHDELAFVIGKKLNIHIANEARIHEALERHYDKDLPARFAHLLERLNRGRKQWKKPTERAATPASPTASPIPRPSTSPPAQPSRPAPVPSRIIAHELKIKSSGPRVMPPGATGSTVTRPPVVRPQEGRSTARPASPAPPEIRQSQSSVRPTTLPTAESQDRGVPRPRSRPIRRRPAAPRRTVALSDQERRSLKTSSQAPAAPAETPQPVPDGRLPNETLPPATLPSKALPPKTPSRSRPTRPPLSLGEVEQLLEKTRQPSEVGRVLLDYLSQKFPRVLLFKVFQRHVAGWMGRGQNLELSRLQAYEIGFDQPSIFLNLRQTGSFFLGRLPDMPAHIELDACWSETSSTHECAIFPIRVRNRAVSYIYIDRNQEGLDGLDFEALRRVSTMAAIAFEMCIMKQKLRRASR